MTETPTVHVRQATSLGVNHPERVIELIVIPYDTEALVDQPYGRPVFESVARGAFDGVEGRPNRIRVNRDHQLARTVGKALSLHPSRTEGLVARLKIARTDLGDETLALAADDCLDASASFESRPSWMTWNRTRDHVRLTKCWLRHVALTPDPAYQGADILAVRQRSDPPPATPRIDDLLAWRRAERYADR